RSGIYLEPTAGEATINNVLKMARQGLRFDLTTALHQAAITKSEIRCPNLSVKTNGHFTSTDLIVCPIAVAQQADLGRSGEDLYLVILQSSDRVVAARSAVSAPEDSVGQSSHAETGEAVFDQHAARVQIGALNEELRRTREHLHAANEQLEVSNEELRSSNEEMQSVNEELQSSNEELETSKEEMQSMNEELTTINVELQAKVTDLSRVNNDMVNLLAGTGIGTIFVDLRLNILRFTPTVSAIINLIQSDVGRPLAHIASNLLGYDRLVEDAQRVLDTLAPIETEVQSSAERWYTMRIMPYRTMDNVIEGAVITFIDITEMVAARQALDLAKTSDRLAVVVRDSYDAITVQDLSGCTLAWNPAATRLYGWDEAEALGMNVRDRTPPDLRDEAIIRVDQMLDGTPWTPSLTRRLTQAGTEVEIWLTVTALINESGRIYAIATTERLKGGGNDTGRA
ncbi:MAG TPA: PAS domain-containing protein, partial [Castellaniella sp.]|nr:PAS domain-containing protein [Castellaniella sp.]